MSLDILFAEFVRLNIMAYKSDEGNSTGIQITSSWNIPFSIGGLNFKFRGFLDWQSASATGGEDSIINPTNFCWMWVIY